jgi:hypothetical protein
MPDRTVRWTAHGAERVIRKDRAGEDEMGLESPAVTKLRAKAEEMAGGSEAAMNRVRQRVEKAEADLERLERGRE